MPIKLDNMKATVATKKLYTPKFFSNDITGSGKKTGLLREEIFPKNLDPAQPEKSFICSPYRIVTNTGKYAKTTMYPIDPLTGFEDIRITRIPNVIKFDPAWCKLSSTKSANGSTDWYIALTPAYISIISPIRVEKNPQNPNADPDDTAPDETKHCIITYKMLSIEAKTDANNVITDLDIKDNFLTDNPLLTLTNQITDDPQYIAAFTLYLQDYNTYDEICRMSEIWQTTLVDTLISFYDAVVNSFPNSFPMTRFLRYLSTYKVSLDQYADLYAKLKTRFSEKDLKMLVKANTSLLLQDTFDGLKSIAFSPLPKPSQTNKTLDLSWCSKEQFDAITSDAPLNLVQAGAGTGKSTVIKSRLDYLDYLGVDLNRVMVLSFTNAAADNIAERCPGIQSMTIAKMIDTIYSQNHPTHQLSQSSTRRGEGSTFTNSLSMYAKDNPLVKKLIHVIEDVEKYNDYASLLRFVEENYDDVIKILDTVKQTTLHLEIIICYLEYANITIPFDIDHLLIDEVQDNAVFEFIFFLKMTCKLKNHLYLVGDCSQTLYEFRASDPKALNAIESSGLFSTFPLNINYRSNQNILSFANALLSDIDANKYANIQLRSFKLDSVTKQSFNKNVKVDYTKLHKVSELNDWLMAKMQSSDIINWINDKRAKKEQVCILAYKRHDASVIQNALTHAYPNAKFASLMSAKNTSFAYFSKYVSNRRSHMLALPSNNVSTLCNRIATDVINNLDSCNVTPKMKQYNIIVANINAMLIEWRDKNAQMLKDNIDRFNRGLIPHDEYVDVIGQSLIDYEITKNAIRQNVLSQKNAEKKENFHDADFVISTIHSAKGLEFDNVIILYHNDNNMHEEDKRMYYVALTRAKKSEYVIAYDTVVNATILSRYSTIIQHLPDDLNAVLTTAC